MEENIKSNLGKSMLKLVVYIVLYVLVAAIVQFIISALITKIYPGIVSYSSYIQILLALAFGYLIVVAFANVIYWNLRLKYTHETSAAIRNVMKIVGIGAILASIAGAVAGGAAGVALGGFIALVIGFGTQQIMGQAIAGMFLLLSRPFKINDPVTLSGETGVVQDIDTLFTKVLKDDGTVVLIPNNSIIGNKIYLLKKK